MDTKAMYALSYGLYVVAAKNDDRINGQIANTVFQISSDPVTVAVSINKQNLTHEFITASGKFSVSILAQETPLEFIGHFGFHSGRDLDKFANVNWIKSPAGLPYLSENTVSCLEASVVDQIDVHTHTVFIGTITDAKVLTNAKPMTYAYYHQIKRGTTPKTAPTYQKQEMPPAANDSSSSGKYQCQVCKYIYDPEQGDPERNIPLGTPFDKLPVDWKCPICGAPKEAFVAL
ncbi:MAG: High molecular weight rubredoxin [Firmicutes bacterium]|nr:High molecular weight rubredoxin [Bacillota bacterium]